MVGTISNNDGEFELNLPVSVLDSPILISHIGYAGLSILPASWDSLKGLIELKVSADVLDDVTVNLGDPTIIVRQAIQMVPSIFNYRQIGTTLYLNDASSLSKKHFFGLARLDPQEKEEDSLNFWLSVQSQVLVSFFDPQFANPIPRDKIFTDGDGSIYDKIKTYDRKLWKKENIILPSSSLASSVDTIQNERYKDPEVRG